MKYTKSSRPFYLVPIFALAVSSASFGEEIAPPGKILTTSAESVTKEEVSSFLGGFRNTVIFYAFKDQKAVLSVSIDNKNKDFPVSATLHEFAGDVTDEGVAKWINNQHSDGLFPDTPEPVKSHTIPGASCRATGHKLVDTDKAPNGEFENYAVTFEIKGVPVMGGTILKDFSDTATVRVKKK